MFYTAKFLLYGIVKQLFISINVQFKEESINLIKMKWSFITVDICKYITSIQMVVFAKPVTSMYVQYHTKF